MRQFIKEATQAAIITAFVWAFVVFCFSVTNTPEGIYL
jgi:hypothetical protein